MVVERKKESTSSAITDFGTAAKCCKLKRVPTEFAPEYNKDEVLEGKFRYLNFSPSTEKTNEYWFELFLSISRYKIFFLKFKTSTLSNNRFAK